jgi:low temperature requirement protein LtrA
LTTAEGAVSEPSSTEKRVSWAELFFDLVFVFAVTQVSALLHTHRDWAGVGKALVVFIPIWWGWVGMSVHANTHDVDNPVDRLGIFAVGLCSLFMALALSDPYGSHGLLFGAGYFTLRVLLAALVFRGPRITLNAFSVGLLVTGPLLLAGGVLSGGWRIGLWAVAGLVDLSTPALVRSRLARIHFEASHLPERFGLFLIVALGESIVATGLAAAHLPLGAGRLTAVASAFALACALWWIYFAFAANAVRYAVATAAVQTDIIRQVLAYGHLVFIGAIIGVAVGMADVVASPMQTLPVGVAALLVGGCALYLATFGYTRWRMFGTVSGTRLVAAAICLPLLALAPFVPALAILCLLVLVLVGLNLFEALWIRRRRARHPAHQVNEVSGRYAGLGWT